MLALSLLLLVLLGLVLEAEEETGTPVDTDWIWSFWEERDWLNGREALEAKLEFILEPWFLRLLRLFVGMRAGLVCPLVGGKYMGFLRKEWNGCCWSRGSLSEWFISMDSLPPPPPPLPLPSTLLSSIRCLRRNTLIALIDYKKIAFLADEVSCWRRGWVQQHCPVDIQNRQEIKQIRNSFSCYVCLTPPI